jgi:hypothetical protein
VRRVLLIGFIVVVLIGAGLLSLALNQQSISLLPGVRVQTANPDASTAVATPGKAAAFFLWTFIALGAVVSLAAVLALITWALNRSVVNAKQAPKQGFTFTLNAAAPNSLGSVLTRRPSVTIAVIVALLIALSAFLTIALGVFKTP